MQVMLFDGSLEEFLTAVAKVYLEKMPPVIYRTADFQPNLIDEPVRISYDESLFLRVQRAMEEKFLEEALHDIHYGLCHSAPDSPSLILSYILSCFKNPRQAQNFQDPLIMAVTKRARQVSLETHRFVGFVRFSEKNGVYFSKIEPDHDILAFLAPHFAERFSTQRFMILDEKRKKVLLSQNGDIVLVEKSDLDPSLFEPDEYIQSWRTYFHSIAIAERVNPKAQKRSMPQRYWKNLPETEVLPPPFSPEKPPENPGRSSSIEFGIPLQILKYPHFD